MSQIVCLGWGSLIWCSGCLQLRRAGDKPWRPDGPLLPVEFARKSQNGRITLVIVSDSHPLPVLWAELDFEDVDEAAKNLAQREGVSVAGAVGVWRRGAKSAIDSDPIGEWASARGFDAVVWTNLGPKFPGTSDMPPESEVLGYLRSLSGETRVNAENYVRRAPRQIATPYRSAIEAELGWTYDGTKTDPYIRTAPS